MTHDTGRSKRHLSTPFRHAAAWLGTTLMLVAATDLRAAEIYAEHWDGGVSTAGWSANSGQGDLLPNAVVGQPPPAGRVDETAETACRPSIDQRLIRLPAACHRRSDLPSPLKSAAPRYVQPEPTAVSP